MAFYIDGGLQSLLCMLRPVNVGMYRSGTTSLRRFRLVNVGIYRSGTVSLRSWNDILCTWYTRMDLWMDVDFPVDMDLRTYHGLCHVPQIKMFTTPSERYGYLNVNKSNATFDDLYRSSPCTFARGVFFTFFCEKTPSVGNTGSYSRDEHTSTSSIFARHGRL